MDTENNSKLRFGVTGLQSGLERWQVKCLDKLREIPRVALELYLQPETEVAESHHRWGDYRNQRSKRGLYWLAEQYGRTPEARSVLPLPEYVQLKGSANYSVRFSPSSPETRWTVSPGILNQYSLDFILDLGEIPPGEEIVTIPEYGVWTLGFGDDPLDYGTVQSFWDVYNNRSVTRARLVKVLGNSKGVVMREGSFGTVSYSYERTTADPLMLGAHWPAQVCRGILSEEQKYISGNDNQVQLTNTPAPTNREFVGGITQQAKNLTRKIARVFTEQEEWAVGVLDCSVGKLLESTNCTEPEWLENDHGDEFRADPFGKRYNGTRYMLYEEFLPKEERGIIRRCKIDSNGGSISFVDHRDVFTEPGHWSYPYVYEYDGEIYCFPQKSDSPGVDVYKARTFPDSWQYVTTIIEPFPAVDPTVFEYDDRLWLACTPQGTWSNTSLYLFWSREITGPWKSHELNPVKMDITSSRPGGSPFQYGGTLFRPAQDCAGGYGRRLSINRVVELTPIKFYEQVERTIEPNSKSSFPEGFHTITGLDGKTYVDGKRFRTSWRQSWKQVKNIIEVRR
ncbi:MAG: hypothetical protein ABEJ65_00710 [bacterium]